MTPPAQPFRGLPCSDIAERGLLCSFLLAPKEVGGMCTEKEVPIDAFYLPAHGRIFHHLSKMWEEGAPCDIVSLTQRLLDTGSMADCGGAAYVSEIFTYLPTATNAAHYIDILREKLALRKLIEVCTRQAERAYQEQDEPEALVEETKKLLAEISLADSAKHRSLPELLTDAVNRIQMAQEKRSGLMTGLDALDRACGPWLPGNFIVIAGETGGGKSALATNICENVAIAGSRVALFSLEMSPDEVTDRILASQGRLNIRGLMMNPPITEMEMAKVMSALGRLSKARIEIVQNAFTLPQIIAKARKFHAESLLSLVVVDYIQLVGGNRSRGDNRELEVAGVSRGLKKLAVDLGCVVIGLSQLNEQGKLRESRAIGQDANVVLSIEKSDKEDGKRVARILKARSAAGDEIPLIWKPQFTRFETE